MKELKKYKEYWKELVHLENIISLLHWDSEVLIPDAARAERAEQIAYLSKLYHTKYISSEFDDILANLFQTLDNLDLNEEEKFTLKKELEVLNHDRYRAKKLRTELVEELSRITNLALGIWANAKKNKNFSEFAPTLQKIVLLVQEKADQYGYNTERYDALLEDYEIGARASELEELFKHLKNSLIPLINQFQTYPNPFLKPVHKELQYFFNKKLSVLLGLPENAHRLDTSQHPFSTSLGANDKRITTRYDETDPLSSVFAVLHETGHALYEYGLSQAKNYPSPLTTSASYGIHESQSRLWENQIGRSRPFWEFIYPTILKDFNIYHYDLPFEKLYNYVNSVSRSKIRIEADQVT
ncbi:MAG: carboxypeptidase M32, partial [Leptospiraceae bacterium]|nr:carboxypeptidase M32 [Leptospiraceae bacterium]